MIYLGVQNRVDPSPEGLLEQGFTTYYKWRDSEFNTVITLVRDNNLVTAFLLRASDLISFAHTHVEDSQNCLGIRSILDNGRSLDKLKIQLVRLQAENQKSIERLYSKIAQEEPLDEAIEAQRDIKEIYAYSSASHLNIVRRLRGLYAQVL